MTPTIAPSDYRARVRIDLDPYMTALAKHYMVFDDCSLAEAYYNAAMDVLAADDELGADGVTIFCACCSVAG